MYIRYKLTVCAEQGAPRRTQWEESCPFDTVRMSQNATEARLRSMLKELDHPCPIT